MNYILLRTTVATLIAFLGGALGVALGQAANRRLNLLVYAAAGALLAVTVCDVLPDAKEILTWQAFFVSVASGYALFWIIGKYVYHICPACAISEFDAETTQRLSQTAVLLLIALGIHSTMDGIAVVVGDKITGHANLGVLFAVSLHKLPEGMALALLLIGAGYTRQRALLWTFGIEATTELGGLIGVFALKGVSTHWLGLLFGHVGGGFLYLVMSTFGAFSSPQNRPQWRHSVAVSALTFILTASILQMIGRYVR